MTAAKDTAPVEPRITLEDVKHRAETVRDLAVTEAKQTTQRVMDETAGRTLLIVAGVVVIAASLAFYLGSRSVTVRGPEV